MSKIEITSEEQWHQLRRNNIGSSDAASLFGHNKFQSGYVLWLTKRGLIEVSTEGNDRSEWGKRFEAPIAYGLAQDNGWIIEKAGYYYHPTIKGMGCTPDFIIKANDFMEVGCDGDGILEIKMLEHWGYFGEFTDDEANHYIEVQIQHQLACTGLKWAALGVKMPGQTPVVKFIRLRDESFIALLEKKVVDFWNSTTPPAPDGSDSSSDAVKQLYRRQHNKETIDLTGNNELPELIGLLDSFKTHKKHPASEIRRIEKEEKAIKNQILALSQGSEVIKFSQGEIKINTVERSAVAPCSYQTVTYKFNEEINV